MAAARCIRPGHGYRIVDDASSADAVLTITLGGVPPNVEPMYEAAGANFKPEYSVSVKLLDARTNQMLFSQFYIYRDNSLSPLDGTVLIRPEARYGVGSARDLFANPAKAVEGFRAAIPIVAKSVGVLLKRP